MSALHVSAAKKTKKDRIQYIFIWEFHHKSFHKQSELKTEKPGTVSTTLKFGNDYHSQQVDFDRCDKGALYIPKSPALLFENIHLIF